MAKKTVSFSYITNTGLVREHNEDNVSFLGKSLPEKHGSMFRAVTEEVQEDRCAAAGVFDGMGGEAAGEAASGAAAAAFAAFPFENGGGEELSRAFSAMEAAVASMAKERRISLTGTTAVTVLTKGKRACIGHLGDSPAFLFRNGQLTLLTKPHTDAELMEKLGIRTGGKGRLTRFVGMSASLMMPEPDLKSLEIRPGDRLLLCSDGLSDLLKGQELAGILASEAAPGRAAEELFLQAMERGGKDNITVLLVQYPDEMTGEP